MANKKKHPNLPYGYGTIRKLSGNRRNPYSVHPPVTEFTVDGKPIMKKALCYVSDWYVGFAVLTAYKAGTYKPGMEKDLEQLRGQENGDLAEFTNRILSDYNVAVRSNSNDQELLFSELYDQFYNWKFNGKKKYSASSKQATRTAYNNCKALYNKKIGEITYEQLQRIVDSCQLKHASLELIVSLLKQIYRYALAQNLVEKNPTELLRINIPDDDEHGVPFNIRDLERLWEHADNYIAQLLLIMCYSGYRIGELSVISVDLEKRCFSGGLKTNAGKNRIVPIHSSILPIVQDRLNQKGSLMGISYNAFNKALSEFLKSIGVGKHTAHDCRHTFSMLCEKYKVSENDRKRMLGHSFRDITNSIYGHRSLEDLRKEIEKIPCYKRVANDYKKRA